MAVVEQGDGRDRGDVGRVDGRVGRVRVTVADHAGGADLLRPYRGVGHELPRAQVGPFDGGGFDGVRHRGPPAIGLAGQVDDPAHADPLGQRDHLLDGLRLGSQVHPVHALQRDRHGVEPAGGKPDHFKPAAVFLRQQHAILAQQPLADEAINRAAQLFTRLNNLLS